MDPLHLAIAFVPLAVYLLVLGLINLSPRPFLTTGSRDSLALAVGLSGMVIAGPMELFLPERAAQTFGPYVWALMVTLYLLTCVLISLMGRPKLVIYNIASAELKPLLEKTLKSIDPAASWVDDTYVLPNAFVQLHVQPFSALRNVCLNSIGTRQSWQSWRRLEESLAESLRSERGVSNPYGITLIAGGLVLLALSTYFLVDQRQTVAQALLEMLRI